MRFDVGSGIRAFRIVLIGALVVVASAPAATAATAGFGSPAPGRPVLQWLPEEFATSHTYTQAQAVTAATRYDVIVAYTQAFQPYLASMRAANPNLVVLAYMNGTFVPPAQATSWPADWYSYDANGIKVQNAQNKNYLMNPTNAGWVQNRATMCANLVAQSGYDGCMLDTLGVAPLTAGYCTALPINPATGAAWARPDWISATTQLSNSVRSTVSPSLVVGNGLKDGPSLGESSQLFNGMDGGIAEGFLRTSTQSATTYPTVSIWQQNVNMLLSPPKPMLALTKVWASATTAQLNQYHLYALASFLLGTDGRSYFYFSSASSEPPISVVPWSVNIGDPSGSYSLQDGAYQRLFTQGRVLVNPTASQVTVPLSGAYTEMDGTQVSGSLVMPPNTGQILQTVPASVPGAPTGVSAVAGDASASVSFSAPGSDGGSAISGYTVTAADATTPGNGGQVVSGGGSPLVVSGLTNGDVYSFTVTATNGVGTGPASAPSNSVTPSAPALLTLTTPTPGFGVAGVGYTYKLNATGGTPPYTWALTSGSLPPGLRLASTGTISGTPTAAGSWTFGIIVRDASTPANSLTSALTLQIYPKAKNGSGTETISPTTATRGSSGNTFTLTYTASATGALFDGKLKITVPTGWTAPSKTTTSAGLVTTSTGSVSVSGQAITISGIRLRLGRCSPSPMEAAPVVRRA